MSKKMPSFPGAANPPKGLFWMGKGLFFHIGK